jgi:hypothetical protein
MKARGCVEVQLNASATLLPGVIVSGAHSLRLCGTQGRSRRFEETKYLLLLPEIEPQFLDGPGRTQSLH